jgi:hypothetical protein
MLTTDELEEILQLWFAQLDVALTDSAQPLEDDSEKQSDFQTDSK